MESTKNTDERPSTQHLLEEDRLNEIYSLEMDFTSITLQRWSTKNLLMRNGVLLFRNGVHISYTLDIVYTTFNFERWCTHNLLKRDGDYNIYL